MVDNDDGTSVELYVYDLTGGLAASFSALFVGKHIAGLWHTSIVAYGREYFFGAGGIQNCLPGNTVLNQPLKKEKLGITFVPYQIFIDYIVGLNETTFAGSTYNLIDHNCNNFSDEIAQFLCGVRIPSYILNLPEELLSTPIGQQLRLFLDTISSGSEISPVFRSERAPSPDLQRLNQQIEEARLKSLQLEEKRNSINEKLARRERKKEKKRQKQLRESGIVLDNTFEEDSNSTYNMEESDVALVSEFNENNETENHTPNNTLPSEMALELEAQERREEEERKKRRDPPIIYKDDVNIQTEFDALVGLVDGKLNEEEQRSLEELHQYMLEDEGSWALGEDFLNFIGRLLYDKSLSTETRVHTLNVLALAALKDDVVLLLHQDRREHILMNYSYDVDRLPSEEQEALALLICNLFENLSSSEWLLYISEWSYCNQQISNIRVTTKVAVHALLADAPRLRELGAAIVHNLACKEVKTVVFDDVAVELAMAVLQFFQSKPSEELLYRCMKALARFTQISGQEVPQLIQMIGPDPKAFKGVSDRIDVLVEDICRKLR